MHCISQINNQNEETIVHLLKSPDNFLSTVQKINKQPYVSILEETNLKYIKDDIFVGTGFYLLNSDKQIQLIEKFEYKAKGYIRDYVCTDVKIICTWRLIPINLYQTRSINNTQSTNEIIIDKYKYQIQKFNLDDTVENPTYLIIGDSPDKNLLIGDLVNTELKKQPDLDILVISSDEQSKLFFPTIDVHHAYNSKLIQDFINLGKRGIIILDICLSDCKADATLNKLIYNARHCGITLILSIQSPSDIQPEYRLGCDYVFLFGTDDQSNQKKIYAKYAHMFPEVDIFEKVFSEITANFTGMVINNRKILNGVVLYFNTCKFNSKIII